MKSLTKPLVLLTLLLLGSSIWAQPALYVEGTHYDVIEKPVRTVDPNKVEVVEVFWYGCPHCYAFEPLIESWTSSLPSDVVFVRSPGMWNELMEVHAQLFYTAQTLDVLDSIHEEAFTAFHQKGNYLQTVDEVRALFVAQGVDPAEFDKAWNSFSVTSAVKAAGTKMRDYGIRGVPNLVVNGKYRITTSDSVRTQADMLKVADFLIAQERKS